MACWPANTVGAFTLALLIFDFIQKDYTNLPTHALFGVILVALFWIVCNFVDESVSAGLLLVPLVFLGIFVFTIWFTGQSLQKQGCCLNCSGSRPVKAILVRKSDGTEVATSSLGSLGGFTWNPKASTETIRRELNLFGKTPTSEVKSTCVPLSLNANKVI